MKAMETTLGYVHPIDLDGCTVYDAETLECMAREEVARKSKEKGFPITLVSWDIRVSTHGASLATWGKSRRHPGTVFSCGLMAI